MRDKQSGEIKGAPKAVAAAKGAGIASKEANATRSSYPPKEGGSKRSILCATAAVGEAVA
jgi:hypothetical protein